MIFLEDDFSVKILSVQKLSWEHNDTYVRPRAYNALSFRVKGSSVFSDGKTQTLLHSGDILFMPKNVGYYLKSNEEELIVVHFDLVGQEQDHFEVIRPNRPDLYYSFFSDMYDHWNERKQGYHLLALSDFYSLLARLYKHILRPADPAYGKIKSAVYYLQQHFTDPSLNVEQLCSLSGVSDTYFRRLFYSAFHTTPKNYLNLLRTNYARELLETGYYTVEEVSEKCGFSDSKYFSTVYKKYQKTQPSKARPGI